MNKMTVPFSNCYDGSKYPSHELAQPMVLVRHRCASYLLMSVEIIRSSCSSRYDYSQMEEFYYNFQGTKMLPI